MVEEDEKLTFREEAERLAIRGRYRAREFQKKPVVKFIKTLAKGAGRSATKNIRSNQGKIGITRPPKSRRIRRGSPARLSKPAFFGATMLSEMDMPSGGGEIPRRKKSRVQNQFVIIKQGGVKNRRKKTKRRKRRRQSTPKFDFIDYGRL